MSGLTVFDNADSLIWKPEIGVGFYPVDAFPYNEDYFEHYKNCECTKIGKELTEARVNLVMKYESPCVVDVGIGSGQFLRAYNCQGYDINPVAIKLLGDMFLNPYENKVQSATFWDSMEHIKDFDKILENVIEYAFVSMPIYRDCEHVLKSKHFKKDEHCWYFTDAGFHTMMLHYGFKVVESNDMETEIGREDIKTYVLRRICN